MSDDASIIRRLRRVARDSGFEIEKRGDGYRLVHVASQTLVAGGRFELTLKDVAIALQKVGVLGYGGA